MSENWKNDPRPARLAETLDDGMVRCHLSPRNCKIRPGQHGFCMVRANHDGRLVTLNYGRSVHATEETIETEAVFNFAPGDPILSMGNIGCMLNCDYCHNWKTSQARFVADGDVYNYTPEQVVDIAERHGIRVISWTYNDPVVWHEFVRDTAALAQQRGMINLFKSAFFISPEAVEELLPVIDIFSVSIKSMDPKYYRRLTKGWIEPVLAATKQVYDAGKHVEVSTLMVTDLSDNEKTARDIATFVGEQLDPSVPLHFVRFHPDYKMTNTVRTPIERVEAARRVAQEMGIHSVYVGNVYDTDSTTTWCRGCGNVLVTRYGLNAQLIGVSSENSCTKCGEKTPLKLLGPRQRPQDVPTLPAGYRTADFSWHGDVRSLHIQLLNESSEEKVVYHRRFGDPAVGPQWAALHLAPGESYRFAAAKATPDETGVEVAVIDGLRCSLHEVFDRAHFPTVTVDTGTLNEDVTPFPSYVQTAASARALSVVAAGEDGEVAP
jgi:pyruvate formate lyase activating enzyme